jgi:hypothetical protein
MTRNRVVDKEMYHVRLALDLFWGDNRSGLCGAPSQTTLRTVQVRSAHYCQEYFKSNLLLKSPFNWAKVKESKDLVSICPSTRSKFKQSSFYLGVILIDEAGPLNNYIFHSMASTRRQPPLFYDSHAHEPLALV